MMPYIYHELGRKKAPSVTCRPADFMVSGRSASIRTPRSNFSIAATLISLRKGKFLCLALFQRQLLPVAGVPPGVPSHRHVPRGYQTARDPAAKPTRAAIAAKLYSI
jgi:hypothetical protein